MIPYETFVKLSTALDKYAMLTDILPFRAAMVHSGVFFFLCRFVVMTYDFSKSFTFGPNAPIGFVEEAITTVITRPDGTIDKELAANILVGIPMYGEFSTPNECAGDGDFVSSTVTRVVPYI